MPLDKMFLGAYHQKSYHKVCSFTLDLDVPLTAGPV